MHRFSHNAPGAAAEGHIAARWDKDPDLSQEVGHIRACWRRVPFVSAFVRIPAARFPLEQLLRNMPRNTAHHPPATSPQIQPNRTLLRANPENMLENSRCRQHVANRHMQVLRDGLSGEILSGYSIFDPHGQPIFVSALSPDSVLSSTPDRLAQAYSFLPPASS